MPKIIQTTIDVIEVNIPNSITVAVITLTDVRDIIAITLGIVSIISTLIIIRNNTRRNKDK